MQERARMQAEFSRQGRRMLASPAFDAGALAREIEPMLADAGRGRILEWACGPGLLAHELAPRARCYVGVDITRPMLSLASRRCATGAARFLQTDVLSLPFADGSFDASVSRLAVHHLREPERALAEVARVLRPGGVAVIADIEGCADADDARLHDALEALRDPTHARLLPGGELCAMLEDQGLRLRAQRRFERDRRFSDWAALVDDPARTEPLEVVMRALARAGREAGIRLREEDGELRFLHRWQILAAERRH